MRSQTKWGLFFIVLGAIVGIIIEISIPPIYMLPILIYPASLVIVGLALIILRKREERIEEVNG
jgi:hypothetical protein